MLKPQKPTLESTLAARVRDAGGRGYARGLANKHTDPIVYETPQEWAAWLNGWRAGQAERAGIEIRERGYTLLLAAQRKAA